MTNSDRNEALAPRAGAATGEPARRAAPAAEVERSLDEISRWMDGLFRVPGTGWRFGLDALVGLVPGLGDTATTVVSFYILAAGVRYRVPKVTLLRMAANIAVDYLLGAVPVLGDLFDFAWKSNQMNVELIRRRATVAPDEARSGRVSDWLFVGLIMLALLLLLVGTVTVAWWILSFFARHVPSPF
ncbi:MAG TPA: DUF4112 domain-containing protein [Pyrinomonadaceae bacterium]|nr:DUF4112 domain-containing protein [Pyrinomonadaceae bacterium]